MFNSYWRAFRYIGLATLVGLFVGFLLGRIEQDQQNIGTQNNAEATQDSGEISYGLTPPVPPLLAAPSHPPVGNDEASNQSKQSEDRDLRAQEWMAFATFWMLISTTIGVYFLWRTLSKTAQAVKAADDAVTVTRQIGVRQSRAYVRLRASRVRKLKVGKRPVLEYIIENSGQTPAYETKFFGVVWVTLLAPHDCPVFFEPFKKNMPRNGSVFIVSANSSQENEIWLPRMGQADFDAIQSGDSTLMTAGYVTYRDVFNRKRKTTFKAYLDLTHPKGAKGFFRSCKTGNKAT